MKTLIKASETRQPTLTRAVLRAIGNRDSLVDVCNHGASGGFCGFTMYSDTLKFFKAHKNAIMERLEEDASEFGTDPLSMVAGFQCLKGDNLTTWDVSKAIHGKGDDVTSVQNALAWYALEEIARELNPEL